jgi:hypothetical protein
MAIIGRPSAQPLLQQPASDVAIKESNQGIRASIRWVLIKDQTKQVNLPVVAAKPISQQGLLALSTRIVNDGFKVANRSVVSEQAVEVSTVFSI